MNKYDTGTRGPLLPPHLVRKVIPPAKKKVVLKIILHTMGHWDKEKGGNVIGVCCKRDDRVLGKGSIDLVR